MTSPQQEEPRALTDLVEYLTYVHQQEQESLAAEAALGLSLLWPILRFADLDGSTPSWLHATTLQIESKFRESEALAFDFVQGVKWASLPLSDPLERVATAFPTRDVQTAMRVTGPVSIKVRQPPAPVQIWDAGGADIAPQLPAVSADGLSPAAESVMERAKLESTGVGVKHVMNGGRGEVQTLVQKDFVAAEREVKAVARSSGETQVLDRMFATLQGHEAELAELRESGGSAGRIERLESLVAPLRERLADYVPTVVPDRSGSPVVKPAKRDKRMDLDAAKAARDAIGFARVTDSDPCYFCAVLASQGAVFLSQDAFDVSNSKIREANKWRKERRAFLGDGPAKVHDHCQCQLRPVYRKSDGMDKRAKKFLKQWETLTEGLGGKEAMSAFRRGYKPPAPNYGPPVVDLEGVRRNRELIAARLGDGPQVAGYDKFISQLA